MTYSVNSPKKQVIIHSAAELFREKGFSATSIRDLAAKVGLEPSSIYSHIKSKEELLVEICLPFAEYFTNGMNEVYTSDQTPKRKIRDLIMLHLNVAYDHPASVTVFNDEWRFLPGNYLTQFLEMRKEYEKKFKEILNEGKKAGKFDFENVDIVFSFIIKTLHWSYEAVNKYKKMELEENIISLLTKALNKP
jgi:AcrR family transcriptional regulator